MPREVAAPVLTTPRTTSPVAEVPAIGAICMPMLHVACCIVDILLHPFMSDLWTSQVWRNAAVAPPQESWAPVTSVCHCVIGFWNEAAYPRIKAVSQDPCQETPGSEPCRYRHWTCSEHFWLGYGLTWLELRGSLELQSWWLRKLSVEVPKPEKW